MRLRIVEARRLRSGSWKRQDVSGEPGAPADSVLMARLMTGLLAAAVVLAACGGSGSDSASIGSRPALPAVTLATVAAAAVPKLQPTSSPTVVPTPVPSTAVPAAAAYD